MELNGPTGVHTSVLTSLDQHTARRTAKYPLVGLIHRVMLPITFIQRITSDLSMIKARNSVLASRLVEGVGVLCQGTQGEVGPWAALLARSIRALILLDFEILVSLLKDLTTVVSVAFSAMRNSISTGSDIVAW